MIALITALNGQLHIANLPFGEFTHPRPKYVDAPAPQLRVDPMNHVHRESARGLFRKMPSATVHTCSSPSGRVKSERSPVSTSWRRSEYAGNGGPCARRAQGQSGCTHPEGHLGPWLLDNEPKIDLPVPGQFETEDASAAWLTR